MLYTKFKSISLLVIGLLVFFNVSAQNVQDSAVNEVSASLNYQSKLHYFGRVDSLESSGFFPTISFKSKTGLFLNSSFIFVQNALQSFKYTGTMLQGGYQFPFSKNFSGNIYYNHFLYQDQSSLQQAALKGQAGINTTYNNKVVNVNLGGDVKFSEGETDFGITGGLDRLFLINNVIENGAIALNPSVTVSAGTHNFYKNVKKNNGQGLGVLPSNNSSIEQTKKFALLSYELAVPVILVKGKFNAYITPSYVVPQNLVTVSNRPDLTEKGSNMFYFTAGVGIRL